MIDIKYLVFGGGGAAGYAFAGAIEQLGKESYFSFEKIQAVAGVSAGSLAALAVALNYSSDEASKKLASLQLKKLQDGGWSIFQWYRLLTEYGRYKGEFLFQFVCGIIKEKISNQDPTTITFADLKKLGFKDLYIVATKLYKENETPTGKQKIFSYENTPNTAVASAIRASIAAPTYFSRVRFKKIEKGKYVLDNTGDLYDDGGLLNNFPIDIFDHSKFFEPVEQEGCCVKINPHTLGLALRDSAQIIHQKKLTTKTIITDGKPFEFAEGVMNSLLMQLENEKLDKHKNLQRTIQIDRRGVKLGDFEMNETTKQILLESAREAVKDYFIAKRAKEIDDITEVTDKILEVGQLWQPARNEKTVSSEMENKEEAKPVPQSSTYRCSIM